MSAASLSGATEDDFGEYKANIQITLDEYPNADFSTHEHIIDFKITPSCSTPGWGNLPTDLDIVTSVGESAKLNTFDEVTYDEDMKYNDYCGDPVYSLIGGDTTYLTFDADTRTLSAQTNDALEAGTYNH